MAKAKSGEVRSHVQKPRKKRPGIHAKKKSSRSKNAKNYQKIYVGQGK